MKSEKRYYHTILHPESAITYHHNFIITTGKVFITSIFDSRCKEGYQLSRRSNVVEYKGIILA